MTQEQIMLYSIGKIEHKNKFFNSQIKELREVIDTLSITEIRKLRHCVSHDGDFRNREHHAKLNEADKAKYEDALAALYGDDCCSSILNIKY